MAGDLNSSETFDYLWHGDPSGNREIMDRMNALGFYDCFQHRTHREHSLCPPQLDLSAPHALGGMLVGHTGWHLSTGGLTQSPST